MLVKHARWAPAAVIALLWLVGFASALAVRLPYPYDLEWMEGGMLAHAAQLPGLYGPPRTDFVPFVYPPLYPALLALLGPSPLVGRALSLLGTLLAAGSLASMVQDRRIGVLAAISFLATWNAGGAFFDLVRPDGLALGLLSLGIALAWHDRRGSSAALVAGFFLKQSTGFFLPAVILGIAARDGRKKALLAAATIVLPLTFGLAALQLSSGGYALTYLVQVPGSHPLVLSRLFPLAWLELGAALPVTTAFATAVVLLRTEQPSSIGVGIPVIGGVLLCTAAALAGPVDPFEGLSLGAIGALGIHGLQHLSQRGWRGMFIAALAGSALVSAVWMRAHHGGFLNVLIPAFWVLALGSALVLERLPQRFQPWVPAVFAAQLALQLWTTPFAELTPTDRDRRAGDDLVARLKQVEGPVWSPYAAWLPTYAGHEPQAHLIGVWDLDHPTGPLYTDVQVFTDAVRTQHWGAIVTSQRNLGFGLKSAYRVRTKLHRPKGVFEPRSGWQVRLDAIWTPK